MIRSLLPHPVYCAFLAVGWMVLKEGYSVGDFLIGYVVAAVIVRALGDVWPGPVRVYRPLRLLRLGADFVRALLVANLVGVVIGWVLGSRAAADAMAMEQKKREERAQRKAAGGA